MQNKALTICKLFKYQELHKDSIKLYGLDYPKVFSRFRCASIKDKLNSIERFNYSSNDENEKEIDCKILNYLLLRSKMKIITFWEKNKDEMSKFENQWSHLFNIYCKKKIELNYETVDSLLYHLFSGEERLDMKLIHERIKKIGIKKGQKQNIYVFLIEEKFNDSKEKLELLEYTDPPIHITKNTFDTYQTGCIYFCRNSLKHLEYQNLNNFLGPWMRKSRVMFLTIRNYIFNRVSSDNYQHIILFSSIVLYILGLRPINDIDMISYQDYSKYDDANKTALNKLNMFPFIDCSSKGTSTWNHYWNDWLKEWSNKSGINNFDDIVYDQNNHFYYFGIKIIGIDVDIVRRKIRNRPNSIADLLMVNKNLKMNVNIPPIKKIFKKYKSLENLTSREIESFKKDGYKLKNKELVKKCETNEEYFLKRIIESLSIRYKDNSYESVDKLKKDIYGKTKLKIKVKIKKSK